MSEVLIVKNITREGPGLLESVLVEQGVTFDVADLEVGDTFPSPTDYKALVVLGGPDSANDATTKMRVELAQIRKALEQGVPYLGICLGLQTLVKAAGGTVMKSLHKEIGFIDPAGSPYSVELTDTGKTDPLFDMLPSRLSVFQLHGETVELTDDMQLLGTGASCQNQIVKVADRAYGVQPHFELTPDMLQVWVAQDPDLQALDGDKLSAEYAAIQTAYTANGRKLFRNFLSIADLS